MSYYGSKNKKRDLKLDVSEQNSSIYEKNKLPDVNFEMSGFIVL